MGNIERRIEKLEDYAPDDYELEKRRKYIALLMKLGGFKAKHNLGDNPSEEEVQEVLDRLRNKRRLYD